MSQPIRQSNLLAAEDFLKVYQSFREVDFTSYDYEGIRASLLSYINQHYPEDFNDFVESNELIVIVDLLAYLATSLALRTDLNSRENFLDTADRRDSVIRLARMLSYNPRRNVPARGLMRIRSVQTTEAVFDSFGRNLRDTTVFWDDPQNVDAVEQFTTILNAAFNPTNPFGKPVKNGTMGGNPVSLYAVNTPSNALNNYSVNLSINNEAIPFNIVNMDFEDGGNVFERHPDPAEPFHLMHVNDGQGTSSVNNGFFVYFKQGDLVSETFNFELPDPNRILELSGTDINEQDVYFQKIDASTQEVTERWTAVPGEPGSNLVYNGIDLSERQVFTQLSKLNDQVDLKFSDGVYGEIPKGFYRAWYRTSANRYLTIRPENASNVRISVQYIGKDQQSYSITITADLEYTVTNSAPSETTDEIKLRAPQVYYTQNRMVNAEDYNVFPLSRGNEIAKIHAVNRTHAGHSRYVDINDPTGHIQNLDLNGNDGAIYIDFAVPQSEMFDMPSQSETNSARVEKIKQIFINNMSTFINNKRLRNFYFASYMTDYLTTVTENPYDLSAFEPVKWLTIPTLDQSQYGMLFTGPEESPANVNSLDFNAFGGRMANLREGTALIFIDPDDETNRFNANIVSIRRNGIHDISELRGPITLSREIPRGWVLHRIIPNINLDLADTVRDVVFSEGQISETVFDSLGNSFQSTNTLGTDIITKLNNGENFYLRYEFATTSWHLEDVGFNRDLPFSYGVSGQDWMIFFARDEVTDMYEVVTRGDRYVFESYKQTRFFYDTNNPAIDPNSGLALVDQIRITSQNTLPAPEEVWTLEIVNNTEIFWNRNTTRIPGIIVLKDRGPTSLVTIDKDPILGSLDLQVRNGFVEVINPNIVNSTLNGAQVRIQYASGVPMPHDQFFHIVDNFVTNDGHVDQARVEIAPADFNQDGVSENPLAFQEFVNDSQRVFFNLEQDYQGYLTERVWRTGILNITASGNATNIDPSILEYNGYNLQEIGLITMTERQWLDNLCDFVQYDILSIRQQYDVARNLEGKIVYVEAEETFYELALIKHFSLLEAGEIQTRYAVSRRQSVKRGRTAEQNTLSLTENPVYFRWIHYAPINHRIDPSPTNIVDMYILTTGFYNQVDLWKKRGGELSTFPAYPTTNELELQFNDIKEFKMVSDEIIFRPARFKVLFGRQARQEYQAVFNVVKIPGVAISDNEVKTNVVAAIDKYFEISNWNFGERFYYTELASYIHTVMAGQISSVVIVPRSQDGVFGELFQVRSETNELFLSTATVDDVEIVSDLTEANLKIKK